MEHRLNPFHGRKHAKTSMPSKAVRLGAVIIFVLVVAGLVVYLRTQEKQIFTINQNSVAEEAASKDAIVGNVWSYNSPEEVDLTMVENDLDQTSKNIETVDNFENL